MNREKLIKTAQDLVTDQKGILAADQSAPSAEKLLDIANVESSAENRRVYRQMLFTAPGIEKYIGGVILHDETIRQKSDDGVAFAQLLSKRGITPGIKVDMGKSEMANFPGDFVTEGLDGLRERLKEYKKMGAKFAKWRATYSISDSNPSGTLITSNAENLARYAALCQEQGIVPIVEPEVLMDGKHDITRSETMTTKVLEMLFERLFDHRVVLEGVILKSNMIHPGKDSGKRENNKAIAEFTERVMKRVVSVAVPSVVFLSGGMTPAESTQHLEAINELGPHPWKLNFSFGRALQQTVLKAWGGKDENIRAAQKELLKRAKLNSLALRGEYKKEMENE